MAKRTITQTTFIDDIDGGPAASTVTFGYEGSQYEIDLSKSNAKAFEKTMSLYVGHARKIRNTRAKAGRSSSSKPDLAAIREWAKSNGYEVSDRGRIAGEVLDAYDAAR